MCGDDAVLHRGRHAHDTRARLGASEGASPVIHLQVLALVLAQEVCVVLSHSAQSFTRGAAHLSHLCETVVYLSTVEPRPRGGMAMGGRGPALGGPGKYRFDVADVLSGTLNAFV